jgi:cell division protein FtsB
MTVGAVGFGPSWTVEDSMAASIVRLEQDNQELRAANAVAEQERAILVREMQRLREQIADYRGKELTSMDDLRESCRDKEAADRAGGNPWSAW